MYASKKRSEVICLNGYSQNDLNALLVEQRLVRLASILAVAAMVVSIYDIIWQRSSSKDTNQLPSFGL